MSAFNARKYNPVMGELYRRRVSRGKSFKQAMTACMRELLVLMNTLLAEGCVGRCGQRARPGVETGHTQHAAFREANGGGTRATSGRRWVSGRGR